MEDADLIDGNLLSDKIKINLYMLGALMLNGAGGEVHGADIIAVDKCTPRQRGMKLVEKPSGLSRAVCNGTILGLSAGARDNGMSLGQPGNQVRLSRDGEARGLAVEECLGESVVEEDIFHVELLNRLVTGDSSGEHCANSGRFYNWAEGLVVVDSGALSETPKDPTSLVVIKGPVSTELVREDPLADDNIGVLRSGNQLPGSTADQGSVLFLYSSDRTTSKMRGFVSQDHIGGFSTKRECANTHK
jgi:hypothetical protein